MHTATTATLSGSADLAASRRINRSLTARIEKRVLHWMATRTPLWINSDHLTLLGLGAQIATGIAYAIARHHRYALVVATACIALNWLGDSLDGTLARVRSQQRPRYGFYVDHMVDLFGALALIIGLGCSGFIHWPAAVAMLVAFLLLASESYLATHTLSCFQLSQGCFGPTEIRLLLIAGNIALLRSPYANVFGHRMLLFDLGGSIAAAAMFLIAVAVTLEHTAQLYRQEPLP